MADYLTSVDICNKALQELGCAMISALTDNSRNANECNFLYDKARVALLREHVWGFSIAYATLAPANPATQTFQNGTSRNVFTLPAGYIRIADQMPRTAALTTQATTGGVKFTDYSIEASNLLSASPAVLLRYASDVTNVVLMDALFCDSLAARMNVDGLAMTLTGSPANRQLAERRYEERIELAKTVGLIESAGDEPLERSVQTARILEKLGLAQPEGQSQGGRR